MANQAHSAAANSKTFNPAAQSWSWQHFKSDARDERRQKPLPVS